MPHRTPWISEPPSPPCEIAAVARVLQDQGVSARDAMRLAPDLVQACIDARLWTRAADPAPPPARLAARQGYAQRVARVLASADGLSAGMKQVAAQLNLCDRTLRRRLAEEGTSFSTVATEVRRDIATRHLADARANIEDVAAISGYSDAANFRRAFMRWTNMSPAAYRRMREAGVAGMIESNRERSRA